MVFLPDSHCHLDMEEFASDRAAVLDRARAAGVSAFLCPADVSDSAGLQTTLDLAAGNPDITTAAGLHPHKAWLRDPKHLETIRKLAAERRISAIGEIGLDYHYHFASPDTQRAAFREQVALAAEVRLPVIVHSRLAGTEIIETIEAERFTGGGILHCFTETKEIAEAAIARGFYISFSGILTFPNAADLREIARALPLDRILVETDAPYLAPVPFRGKRNEPAYVMETAKVLAALRGLDPEALAAAATTNFRALFPKHPSSMLR